MNISNSVTLIGNLGNDFEVKNLGNGRTLAKNSLATSQSYKNKDGEYVQQTEWHNIIVWGKKAETIAKYASKGSSIAISGKLTYNQYEDANGNKKKYAEIAVEDFKFLSKKGDGLPF